MTTKRHNPTQRHKQHQQRDTTTNCYKETANDHKVTRRVKTFPRHRMTSKRNKLTTKTHKTDTKRHNGQQIYTKWPQGDTT